MSERDFSLWLFGAFQSQIFICEYFFSKLVLFSEKDNTQNTLSPSNSAHPRWAPIINTQLKPDYVFI